MANKIYVVVASSERVNKYASHSLVNCLHWILEENRQRKDKITYEIDFAYQSSDESERQRRLRSDGKGHYWIQEFINEEKEAEKQELEKYGFEPVAEEDKLIL